MGEAIDGDQVQESRNALDGVKRPEHRVDGLFGERLLFELQDGGFDLSEVVDRFDMKLG